MRIEYLESTSSTNDYIKRYLSQRENIIVCAKQQTSGRGTKGRAFLSSEGGIYLSALFFYENLPAGQAFEIMAHAAVSVCRTAEQFGVSSEIKWPNDVLAGGKKLCGILIENGIVGNLVDHSIIGIGLNVCNDVSSLGGIATNLSELCGREVSMEAVRDSLASNLLKKSSFSDYLSFVKFFGKPILVTEGVRQYEATACGVLPDGRLEIQENGINRALSSAEIRIKI